MKLARALGATALLAATFATAASAQTAIRIHPVIRPRTVPTSLPMSAFAHGAFGRIARLQTTSFVMRLRSGRLLNVDASDAIASGRVSAPLYVGKAILVTGTLDARGTFVAQTVTRMEHIDSETRADH